MHTRPVKDVRLPSPFTSYKQEVFLGVYIGYIYIGAIPSFFGRLEVLLSIQWLVPILPPWWNLQ